MYVYFSGNVNGNKENFLSLSACPSHLLLVTQAYIVAHIVSNYN